MSASGTPAIRATVRLRSEQTGGHGSIVEITVEPGWPGPAGSEPPPWALQPSPEVVFIGPSMAASRDGVSPDRARRESAR